ncbi:hypothetical protein BV372_16505 [Nostoc sp. T09]|uniref:hypothetical protein n=1 Tax=Nostoc sp. T09 TaxID=1932621 RepID=UPI000A386787|nr:hypothetical protein [Nostoc sp. T09]OUL33450.1 hypothetical protein BV372_16505 [Nostoc sp. T09]
MHKLFSFALIPLAIASGGIANEQHIPQSGYIIAQQSTDWIATIFQRRPKKRNGARGGTICPIAPGLVETYIVWSDRPLFLWHSSGTNQAAQLVVREYDSQKVVWQQPVNIADQKVFYNAQESLEPGKLYQWQLSGSPESTPWTTFKIMPASDRQKIQADLQTLEQQLKATKASSEEIALKKAEYFLNYEIKHTTESGTFHPWADAFQVLYQVDNPSSSFIAQRTKFVTDVCTQPPSSTTSQIK